MARQSNMQQLHNLEIIQFSHISSNYATMHGRCITRIIPRASLGRLHLILLCVATFYSSSTPTCILCRRYKSYSILAVSWNSRIYMYISRIWKRALASFGRNYIRITLAIDYETITLITGIIICMNKRRTRACAHTLLSCLSFPARIQTVRICRERESERERERNHPSSTAGVPG